MDSRKIVLSIPIFIFLFSYGSLIWVDPSYEGWMANPDPEYWGLHSTWHRDFHFIPDWPIANPVISMLAFALISYILSYLTVWTYDKLKVEAMKRYRGKRSEAERTIAS